MYDGGDLSREKKLILFLLFKSARMVRQKNNLSLAGKSLPENKKLPLLWYAEIATIQVTFLY